MSLAYTAPTHYSRTYYRERGKAPRKDMDLWVDIRSCKREGERTETEPLHAEAVEGGIGFASCDIFGLV